MISISGVTVSSKAPVGAVVGAVSVNDPDGTGRRFNMTLTEGSAGFFNVSGINLVTLKTPIPPGYYPISIHVSAQFARLEDDATFVVQVTPT
jgi:hypothetical protein